MLGAVDLVQPAAAPQLFESETVNMLSSDPAKVVVSAIGSYSCAEVYISRPAGTSIDHHVRVFGRVGDARVLLAEVLAGELTYTVEDTREGAIALSVRGRPCSAFEVECAPKSENFSGIQVFLQAWHADVPHEVTTGPQRVVAVTQGAPAAQSNRWPVMISDGTNPYGTVSTPFFTRLSNGSAAQGAVTTPLFTRLSDGTAAQGGVTTPLFVRLSDGATDFGTKTNPLTSQPVEATRATYSGGGATLLSLAAAANTTLMLAALWNAANSGVGAEIQRITISYWGASTSGSVRVRARRITTAPTTGTEVIPQQHDSSDNPAGADLWIPPTSIAFSGVDFFMLALKPDARDTYVWSARDAGRPIVLRRGQAEGFEIRAITETAMASAMTFGIYLQWTETT